MEYIEKIKFILGEDLRKAEFLVLFFILSSAIDLLGIGLIAPYIVILVDPNAFEQMVFLDEYFPSKNLKDNIVIIASIFLFLVFASKSVAGIYVNKIIINFGFIQAHRLRSILMRKYFLMPYIDYVKGNKADYIYNITQLTEQYSRGVLNSILRLISEGITLVAIIVFLFFKIGVVLLFLIALSGLMVFAYDHFIRDKIKNYGFLSNKHSTAMVKNINEDMHGLKEIRSHNKEGYFYKIFNDNSHAYADVGFRSTLLGIVPRYLVELILVTFFILIVLFYESNINDSLPILGVLGAACMRLIPSVSFISTGLSQIRYGRDAIDRLHYDLSVLPEIDKLTENNLDFFRNKDSDVNYSKEGFISLEFKNAFFSYNGKDKWLINNLSLRIEAGDSIGIMGESGSGKTTLIDVMLGLLDLSKGSVYLNGSLVNKKLNLLRERIAYLPQQGFLIDDSLKKNIAFGLPDEKICLSKVYESIKRAKIDFFVKNLEQGVDTRIGESGSLLSGGLKQRVALARAFYFDKDVFILDESTSSLDVETELEIQKEIIELKGEKTLIIIAHRKEFLSFCNTVYKLNNGKLDLILNESN